jgi:hypothetical protein
MKELKIVDRSGQLVVRTTVNLSGDDFYLLFDNPLIVDLRGVEITELKKEDKGEATEG